MVPCEKGAMGRRPVAPCLSVALRQTEPRIVARAGLASPSDFGLAAIGGLSSRDTCRTYCYCQPRKGDCQVLEAPSGARLILGFCSGGAGRRGAAVTNADGIVIA